MTTAKYFLDFEFIEDGKTIEPISIGIVSEDGQRELYFAFSDTDLTLANDWVKANVLPHLPPPSSVHWADRGHIRDCILAFCDPEKFGQPEFWGYFADYDWVLFCQLFGRMIDLPTGYPHYCMDLKQWMVHLSVPRAMLPEQKQAEHHALHDARWNREVYRYLESVRVHASSLLERALAR